MYKIKQVITPGQCFIFKTLHKFKIFLILHKKNIAKNKVRIRYLLITFNRASRTKYSSHYDRAEATFKNELRKYRKHYEELDLNRAKLEIAIQSGSSLDTILSNSIAESVKQINTRIIWYQSKIIYENEQKNMLEDMKIKLENNKYEYV